MKRTFIDMDGVLVDWLTSATEACKCELTAELKEEFKKGVLLDKIVSNVWDYINAWGSEWWENLRPLPWAHDVYNAVKSTGCEICLLTSPGNFHKHLLTAQNSSAGKYRWVRKYFPGVEMILCYDKYFCAHEKSLLVDDSVQKLEQFVNWNGHIFHWPNQFAILDGTVDLNVTLDKLVMKIASF